MSKALLKAEMLPDEIYPILSDMNIGPDALAAADHANLSTYLIRAGALIYALERVRPDNAQQEEYLTDMVAILSEVHERIESICIDDPCQVMAFNTPEELAEIQNVYNAKETMHD